MVKLENKTGVQAPDATYPFGKSLDRAGATNGFDLNSANLEDYHQFFAKMFDESGLVANGLPDNEVNGFQMFEALLAIFGGVKRKVINIGDWNMDADATVAVAHGIADFTKIRRINAMILNDLSTVMLPLDLYSGSVTQGGVFNLDSTNITLVRYATGGFDDPAFDSTSFNRGYITIDYVD